MVSWFSSEPLQNSGKADHVHFSGWKYTSLQETKEYKNKAFNWKKVSYKNFILLNSRNHNSINKILEDN